MQLIKLQSMYIEYNQLKILKMKIYLQTKDVLIKESILHCIDGSGNTMDVYIDPNKSYWFDENDNNILSTDGIVSELLLVMTVKPLKQVS